MSMDERKDAFENKFAHDAELKFKAEARRNKLLGQWAAPLLGKADMEAYAKEVIMADFEEAGDEDVFRKLRADFDAAGVEQSDHQIRRTMYEMMAELGGPKTDPDEAEWERELHKGWLITLSPDLTVRVVAPLLEGRGAAGMLELESLGLGPSFEEELKALEAMKSSQAPPLVPTEAPGWQSIFEKPLGEVPEGQRDPETQF